MFKHSDPLWETNSDEMTSGTRIGSIGVFDPENNKEKLLFPLKYITYKTFYYAFSKEQIENDGSLITKIKEQTNCKKLILMINSPGGFVKSSYKMARALRENFEEIIVFVPYEASSGGTLVYNETFTSAIVNGSWNVMLGENSSNPLSLEFGKIRTSSNFSFGNNSAKA